MNAKAWAVAATAAIALSIPVAQAADIQYTATSLGGTSWRYDYVVTNDTLPALDEFSVFFDSASFANLVVTASPVGWSSIALQPTETADGVFDSLALNASLAQGASIGGFSVTFNFLSQGAPGSQGFAVIDPFNNNQIVQEGVTRPIPEPQTLAMLLAGLVPVVTLARRRRA